MKVLEVRTMDCISDTEVSLMQNVIKLAKEAGYTHVKDLLGVYDSVIYTIEEMIEYVDVIVHDHDHYGLFI